MSKPKLAAMVGRCSDCGTPLRVGEFILDPNRVLYCLDSVGCDARRDRQPFYGVPVTMKTVAVTAASDAEAQALLDWFTPEQAAKRRDEMAAATRARTAVHFECARCPEQFKQLKELFEHRAGHQVALRAHGRTG